MPDSSEKIKTYHYNNPMETFPGLSIDDLNRYLPAIQTSEDISMENENELRDEFSCLSVWMV